MKRIGKKHNLIEEIVTEANLRNSVAVVMRGTKRKKTRMGRRIMKNVDKVVEDLRNLIRKGEFAVSKYREFLVTDGPKIRKVQSVSLFERIGVNAIMTVIEKHITKRLVVTTAASIKGRGIHYLLNYVRKDLRKDFKNMLYSYKYDIKKFYESIDQDKMMACLRRIFKDKTLLTMLECFVRMMKKGISIGLRSSQVLGNLLLSMYIGHFLKDKVGRKHSYWYCDDGLDSATSKKEAWRVRNIVHERAAEIGLTVKSNERVFPTDDGIDYLGYVIYPTHTGLRKRNKKNAARKLHKLKSRRRIHEIVASLYGQCKHANCKNLFKKLTGIKMSDFVRLKDTGIKPKYRDGKKRFNFNQVNLEDLVGEEFLIVDYETDILTRPQKRDYDEMVARQRSELENYTKNGLQPPKNFIHPADVPKPEGKYVMCIKRNPGTAKEVVVKVWTGDKENWSILDQLRENNLLGKSLCVVEPIKCKGFTRYVLR